MKNNLVKEGYVNWNCRFHPTDWWHEVGCPHKDWTKEELQEALVTAKQSIKMSSGFIQSKKQKSFEEGRRGMTEVVEKNEEQIIADISAYTFADDRLKRVLGNEIRIIVGLVIKKLQMLKKK